MVLQSAARKKKKKIPESENMMQKTDFGIVFKEKLKKKQQL